MGARSRSASGACVLGLWCWNGCILKLSDQFIWRGQIGHMGEADQRHFCGHHRIGRSADLLQRGEQHLPHPA